MLRCYNADHQDNTDIKLVRSGDSFYTYNTYVDVIKSTGTQAE